MIFDEEKAAQAAAYLLYRAGGKLHQVKLMKLLYLAERLSYELHGFGLTNDKLLSVDHGPILDRVQALIDGAVLPRRGGWDTWIMAPRSHHLALKDPSTLCNPHDDLMALSESDLNVLEKVWSDYSRRDTYTLAEETKQLPEVVAAGEGVIAIGDLLRAVGFGAEQAGLLVEHLTQQREIARQFA